MMRLACGHFYVCLLFAVTVHIALHICSDWKEAANSLASVEQREQNASGEWTIILIVCCICGVKL